MFQRFLLLFNDLLLVVCIVDHIHHVSSTEMCNYIIFIDIFELICFRYDPLAGVKTSTPLVRLADLNSV